MLLLSLAGRAEEVTGAAVHRLYAARVLEEPSCAECVRARPRYWISESSEGCNVAVSGL